MTTTQAHAADLAAAQHAVATLTGVIDQLNQLATGLDALTARGTSIEGAADIARFARAAAEQADTALMVANNELKLAQRDQT